MQVVLTIAVPVQQHAVKVHTGQGLDALFEVGQTLVPRIGVGVDARIGVRLALIAIPTGQARQGMGFAIQGDVFLSPRYVGELHLRQGLGIQLRPIGTQRIQTIVLQKISHRPVADFAGNEVWGIQQLPIRYIDHKSLQRLIPMGGIAR